MAILAIDPGTNQSAWVLMPNMQGSAVINREIEANEVLLQRLRSGWFHGLAHYLALEMVASYGMPVGREVFETVLWSGMFLEAWTAPGGAPYRLIYRREVKLHLCGSERAKDSNIRQAILDLYPRTGGGKTPQVGTKKNPGPLYGVSRDLWAALAVGITAQK